VRRDCVWEGRESKLLLEEDDVEDASRFGSVVGGSGERLRVRLALDLDAASSLERCRISVSFLADCSPFLKSRSVLYSRA
jgi:hypothetical protein